MADVDVGDGALPVTYAPANPLPLSTQARGPDAEAELPGVEVPKALPASTAPVKESSAVPAGPSEFSLTQADSAEPPMIPVPASALDAAGSAAAGARGAARRVAAPVTASASQPAVVIAPAAGSVPSPSVPESAGAREALVAAASLKASMGAGDAQAPGAAEPRVSPGEGAFASSLASAAGRTAESQTAPASLPQAPGSLPVLLGAATGQLGEELGQRILWLSGHNLRSAEIRLDPPELGPLQVQVHTHRDGASIQFTTHSAAVKDAVETHLPRLRELLEGSGLNMLDVNVSQQQRGTPDDRQAAAAAAQASRGRLAGIEQSRESAPAVRRSLGLVDDYA